MGNHRPGALGQILICRNELPLGAVGRITGDEERYHQSERHDLGPSTQQSRICSNS